MHTPEQGVECGEAQKKGRECLGSGNENQVCIKTTILLACWQSPRSSLTFHGDWREWL